MSDLKIVNKYTIGLGVFFLIWVPFISIVKSQVDGSSPTSNNVTAVKTPKPEELKFQKCQKVLAEGARLDKNASDLVKKAKALQEVWIVSEMNRLRNSGRISSEEMAIFTDYLDPSDGIPKPPLGKILSLMNKVVRLGYIKPYLPSNVVSVGNQAAQSPSSASYYVAYPECFTELENTEHKMFAEIPTIKSAWGRKLENPMELIP